MGSNIDWPRVAHILSPALVACNTFMLFAGTWSLSDPSESLFDVVLDVAIIGTIILNLFFAVLGHVFLNHRKNKQASLLQWCFSAYLVGIGLMVIGNTIATVMTTVGFSPGSTTYDTSLAIAIILNGLAHVFPIIAGIMLFKITRSKRDATTNAFEQVWSREPIREDTSWEFKPSFKKVIKVIGVACIVFIFLLSAVVAAVFFTGGEDWPVYVAGNLATTMLFVLVPCTLMLVRHVPRTHGRVNRTIVAAIVVAGCVLAGINALPLVQTSSTITSLEAQFSATYGSSWQSAISSTSYQSFRIEPVSIKDVFYTLPLEPVEEQIDVPYMIDKGQTLRFDWYGPEGISDTVNLLPLVIAIHGGSWRLYDKGVYNTLPTSKYIASLGFVVADVQYGLFDPDDPSPFTVKDMVMEIANLTRFLAANTAQFHANVSNTFFLGRSAGAHLALVCGLGHDNPYFTGNYSVGFDCVGIIPFYPPTNMSRWFDNSSVPFFGVPSTQFSYFNPVDLVSPTNPPVLCFQGLADTLVPPAQARQLQERLNALSKTCILGEFPYAGHAFDIFYNYQYNQVCIYYIERFLALNVD